MRDRQVLLWLLFGVTVVVGCAEQGGGQPVVLVDRSPVAGTWYLQLRGDRPVANDVTERFDFSDGGVAAYERSAGGEASSARYTLTYNVSGDILSLSGDDDAPDAPRLTGRIELDDESGRLRIYTHTGEMWLLTRDEQADALVRQARRSGEVQPDIDPRLAPVKRLVEACNQYVKRRGGKPGHVMDLVDSGLVKPEQVFTFDVRPGLSSRYTQMTAQDRRDWLDANCAYLFMFEYAGTGQASSIVVCTLPADAGGEVVIGMADGGVYLKRGGEVSQLLAFQLGELPPRWPGSAGPVAGAEPASD